ncbi:MAG: hypothetical protein WAK93_12860 [Solirubrobacteraceae bacterium]
MTEPAERGHFCPGCGKPETDADHSRCRRRQAATDPPRFCTACGRKLAVQVLPVGFRARCVRCGPVAG